MPKAATMGRRVSITDIKGTPAIADKTLTPGPVFSAGTHDGTVRETLQLGTPADPARTPVEAETPRASERKSREEALPYSQRRRNWIPLAQIRDNCDPFENASVYLSPTHNSNFSE